MSAPDPYEASATVDDVTVIFRRWRAWSDGVRASVPHARDLRYGPSDDETLDLFVPHAGAPLIVFFHGGYWRRMHKDDNTFVARGFGGNGLATAVVNYGLAPAVPLEEIVAQARRAAAWLRSHAAAYGADASRLLLAGHSAGGQLAAMCAAGAAAGAVATLSGLHDLRPLMRSFAQPWLQLDVTRASAMSPTLLAPATPLPVYASAGEREPDVFRAQGRDFAAAWRARGCPATYEDSPGDNHFSIVERLADANDALTRRIASLVSSAGG